MKYKVTEYIITSFLIILFSFNCLGLTLSKENPVYYYVNHHTEMQLIHENLSKSNTIGVIGSVGMGKSELIKKYVEQYEDQYEIIAILNANSNLNQQYLDLIHEINRNICLKEGCNISENPKYAKDNLLKYLITRKKWLLIFDNLHVTENKKIKDIITWRHNGHIIVCSQEGNYLDYQIKMSYLDKRSSNILIKKIMKNPPEHYVEALTELFKGYPYMIATGAIYLEHHPHITVDDYIHYIKNKDNKVKGHLEMCINTMSPQAKEMLNIFAVLDNQKVSRNLLLELFMYRDNFIQSLDELINYGLIEQIIKSPGEHEFRMHDVLRDEVLNLIPNHAEIINTLIDKLNKYLPLNQTVPVRYALMSQPTILANMEILSKNANEYQADIYKSMRVHDILLDHYLKIRDWENCRVQAEWLTAKEKYMLVAEMTNEQKAAYGHYLTNIGVYYDFALSKFITAIKYYENAKKILNEANEYYIIYNTAYFQQALTQIGIGEIENAKSNFLVIERKLSENNVPISSDRVLGGKAKLSLAIGDYDKALEEINILADAEAHLYKQTVATPIFLIKAEILNYKKNFQESYNICDVLYKQESKNFSYIHEVLAKILIQLARAELGLGKAELASEHIKIAILFFEQEFKELNQKHPINDKYAAALTTRGDILSLQGDFENAIKDYLFARKIYLNRYRGNDRNMDNVSYNLLKLARAAYSNKDYKLYKKARNELFQKFGIEHARSKEILSMVEIKGKL
jgi:hypothetical protein